MAVTVKHPGDWEPDETKHEGGNTLSVDDGHLLVTQGGSRVVAIYAPAAWVAAEVGD